MGCNFSPKSLHGLFGRSLFRYLRLWLMGSQLHHFFPTTSIMHSLFLRVSYCSQIYQEQNVLKWCSLSPFPSISLSACACVATTPKSSIWIFNDPWCIGAEYLKILIANLTTITSYISDTKEGASRTQESVPNHQLIWELNKTLRFISITVCTS